MAELKLKLDDVIRRKKADTVSLIFKGSHETESGDFKLTCKFDNRINSFWSAILGTGNYAEIYLSISSKSKQTELGGD